MLLNGISEYLYTLTNDIQFRTDSNIIISKCDASSFLEYSAPVLDKVSARYYDIAPSSSEYTGYTESITCNEFFTAINSNTLEPVAILGSVNTEDTHTNSSSIDSSYTAGETPITGEHSIETMGLAVFNGDKFVGELNGLESICHLIISNKLQNAQIQIPSPIEELENIDLYIELKSERTDKFIRQLKRNHYYLKGLAKEKIFVFSYIANTKEFFSFDGVNINVSSLKEVTAVIKLLSLENAVTGSYDSLFTPKKYLISPFNTPDRFLSGEYFLTDQQEEIKHKIIDFIDEKCSNECRFYRILGEAGTGKTLLLYDF